MFKSWIVFISKKNLKNKIPYFDWPHRRNSRFHWCELCRSSWPAITLGPSRCRWQYSAFLQKQASENYYGKLRRIRDSGYHRHDSVRKQHMAIFGKSGPKTTNPAFRGRQLDRNHTDWIKWKNLSLQVHWSSSNRRSRFDSRKAAYRSPLSNWQDVGRRSHQTATRQTIYHVPTTFTWKWALRWDSGGARCRNYWLTST